MVYRTESVSGLSEFLWLRRDPLAYVAELADRHIDIRHVKIGSRNVFQVNHPDLIQDVLVTHDWNFIKGRGLKASKPVLGSGLLTSEGELHRRQRRLVQPAFHKTRLSNYANVMVDCAVSAAGAWQDGEIIAIDQVMMQLTLDIVGRTLFSADLHHDAAGVGQSLKRALQVFLTINRPLSQLLPFLRGAAEKQGRQARREIEKVLMPVIAEHRRNPEAYDDMLLMLMHAHEGAETGYMSKELLLDECLTLFLAGHETTANALTWTWYLLAQHEEIRDKLHVELREVLGDRSPAMNDLPCLEYTKRIFEESLRLYPPAWVIGREALTAYRLGDIEVPAGSTIMMSPFVTHRDSRFWHEASEFNPDRWMEDRPNRPKFCFYPFGAGTRVCIGEHFAMMEGILLIATLAQRFRFDLVAGQTVELWPQITLRPRNSMQFRLRSLQQERHL
ncbi:MAG: cytochrome P450 [Acidobacteriaceae bacterium]